jgi:hypothetical protein
MTCGQTQSMAIYVYAGLTSQLMSEAATATTGRGGKLSAARHASPYRYVLVGG